MTTKLFPTLALNVIIHILFRQRKRRRRRWKHDQRRGWQKKEDGPQEKAIYIGVPQDSK